MKGLSWLWEKFVGAFDWLWEGLWDIVGWFFEQVQGVFWALGEMLGLFFIWMFAQIPVPAFFSTGHLSNLLANVPASVWYFIGALEIQAGIGIVLAASVVRFGIRRLPFIG